MSRKEAQEFNEFNCIDLRSLPTVSRNPILSEARKSALVNTSLESQYDLLETVGVSHDVPFLRTIHHIERAVSPLGFCGGIEDQVEQLVNERYRLIDGVKQLTSQDADLQHRLQILTRKLPRLEYVKQIEADHDEVMQELLTTQEQLDSTKQQLAAEHAARKKAERKVTKLIGERDAANREKETANHEASRLKRELEVLHEESRRLHAGLDDIRRACVTQQARHKEEIARMQKRNRDIHQQARDTDAFHATHIRELKTQLTDVLKVPSMTTSKSTQELEYLAMRELLTQRSKQESELTEPLANRETELEAFLRSREKSAASSDEVMAQLHAKVQKLEVLNAQQTELITTQRQEIASYGHQVRLLTAEIEKLNKSEKVLKLRLVRQSEHPQQYNGSAVKSTETAECDDPLEKHKREIARLRIEAETRTVLHAKVEKLLDKHRQEIGALRAEVTMQATKIRKLADANGELSESLSRESAEVTALRSELARRVEAQRESDARMERQNAEIENLGSVATRTRKLLDLYERQMETIARHAHRMVECGESGKNRQIDKSVQTHSGLVISSETNVQGGVCASDAILRTLAQYQEDVEQLRRQEDETWRRVDQALSRHQGTMQALRCEVTARRDAQYELETQLRAREVEIDALKYEQDMRQLRQQELERSIGQYQSDIAAMREADMNLRARLRVQQGTAEHGHNEDANRQQRVDVEDRLAKQEVAKKMLMQHQREIEAVRRIEVDTRGKLEQVLSDQKQDINDLRAEVDARVELVRRVEAQYQDALLCCDSMTLQEDVADPKAVVAQALAELSEQIDNAASMNENRMRVLQDATDSVARRVTALEHAQRHVVRNVETASADASAALVVTEDDAFALVASEKRLVEESMSRLTKQLGDALSRIGSNSTLSRNDENVAEVTLALTKDDNDAFRQLTVEKRFVEECISYLEAWVEPLRMSAQGEHAPIHEGQMERTALLGSESGHGVPQAGSCLRGYDDVERESDQLGLRDPELNACVALVASARRECARLGNTPHAQSTKELLDDLLRQVTCELKERKRLIERVQAEMQDRAGITSRLEALLATVLQEEVSVGEVHEREHRAQNSQGVGGPHHGELETQIEMAHATMRQKAQHKREMEERQRRTNEELQTERGARIACTEQMAIVTATLREKEQILERVQKEHEWLKAQLDKDVAPRNDPGAHADAAQVDVAWKLKEVGVREWEGSSARMQEKSHAELNTILETRLEAAHVELKKKQQVIQREMSENKRLLEELQAERERAKAALAEHCEATNTAFCEEFALEQSSECAARNTETSFHKEQIDKPFLTTQLRRAHSSLCDAGVIVQCEIAERQKIVEQLEAQIQEKVAFAAELHAQQVTLINKETALQQAIHEQQSALEQLHADLCEKSTRLGNAEVELEAKEHAIEVEREKRHLVVAELQTVIKTLIMEKHHVQSLERCAEVLHTVDRDNSALMGKVDDLKALIREREVVIERLDGDKERLRVQVENERKEKQSLMAQKCDELCMLIGEKEALRHAQATTEEEIRRVLAEKHELWKAKVDHEEAMQGSALVQCARESVKTQKEEMDTADRMPCGSVLVAEEQIRADNDGLRVENEKLRAAHEVAQRAEGFLTTQKEELCDACDTQQRVISFLSAARDSLRQTNEMQLCEMRFLTDEKKELCKGRETRKVTIESLKAENNKLYEAYKTYQRSIQSLTRETDELRAMTTRTPRSMELLAGEKKEQLPSELEDTYETRVHKDAEIPDVLRAKYEEIGSAYEKMRANYESMRAGYEQLRAHYEVARAKFDGTRLNLEETSAEHEKMRIKFEDVVAKKDSLRAAILDMSTAEVTQRGMIKSLTAEEEKLFESDEMQRQKTESRTAEKHQLRDANAAQQHTMSSLAAEPEHLLLATKEQLRDALKTIDVLTAENNMMRSVVHGTEDDGMHVTQLDTTLADAEHANHENLAPVERERRHATRRTASNKKGERIRRIIVRREEEVQPTREPVADSASPASCEMLKREIKELRAAKEALEKDKQVLLVDNQKWEEHNAAHAQCVSYLERNLRQQCDNVRIFAEEFAQQKGKIGEALIQGQRDVGSITPPYQQHRKHEQIAEAQGAHRELVMVKKHEENFGDDARGEREEVFAMEKEDLFAGLQRMQCDKDATVMQADSMQDVLSEKQDQVCVLVGDRLQAEGAAEGENISWIEEHKRKEIQVARFAEEKNELQKRGQDICLAKDQVVQAFRRENKELRGKVDVAERELHCARAELFTLREELRDKERRCRSLQTKDCGACDVASICINTPPRARLDKEEADYQISSEETPSAPRITDGYRHNTTTRHTPRTLPEGWDYFKHTVSMEDEESARLHSETITPRVELESLQSRVATQRGSSECVRETNVPVRKAGSSDELRVADVDEDFATTNRRTADTLEHRTTDDNCSSHTNIDAFVDLLSEELKCHTESFRAFTEMAAEAVKEERVARALERTTLELQLAEKDNVIASLTKMAADQGLNAALLLQKEGTRTAVESLLTLLEAPLNAHAGQCTLHHEDALAAAVDTRLVEGTLSANKQASAEQLALYAEEQARSMAEMVSVKMQLDDTKAFVEQLTKEIDTLALMRHNALDTLEQERKHDERLVADVEINDHLGESDQFVALKSEKRTILLGEDKRWVTEVGCVHATLAELQRALERVAGKVRHMSVMSHPEAGFSEAVMVCEKPRRRPQTRHVEANGQKSELQIAPTVGQQEVQGQCGADDDALKGLSCEAHEKETQRIVDVQGKEQQFMVDVQHIEERFVVENTILQQQLEETLARTERLATDVADMRTKFRDVFAENGTMKERLNEAEKRETQLLAEMEEKQRQHTTHMQEMNLQYTSDVVALKEKLIDVRSQAQEHVDKIHAQQEELHRALDAATVEKEKLHTENKQQVNGLRVKERELQAALDEEIARYETLHAQKEELRCAFEAATVEKEKLNAKNEKQLSTFHVKEKELQASLGAEKEGREVIYAQLERLRVALEVATSDKEKAIADNKEQLLALRLKKEELQGELCAEIAGRLELCKQLDELRSALDTAAAEKEAVHTEKEEQVASLLIEKEELRASLDVATGAREALYEQQEQLRVALKGTITHTQTITENKGQLTTLLHGRQHEELLALLNRQQLVLESMLDAAQRIAAGDDATLVTRLAAHHDVALALAQLEKCTALSSLVKAERALAEDQEALREQHNALIASTDAEKVALQGALQAAERISVERQEALHALRAQLDAADVARAATPTGTPLRIDVGRVNLVAKRSTNVDECETDEGDDTCSVLFADTLLDRACTENDVAVAALHCEEQQTEMFAAKAALQRLLDETKRYVINQQQEKDARERELLDALNILDNQVAERDEKIKALCEESQKLEATLGTREHRLQELVNHEAELQSELEQLREANGRLKTKLEELISASLTPHADGAGNVLPPEHDTTENERLVREYDTAQERMAHLEDSVKHSAAAKEQLQGEIQAEKEQLVRVQSELDHTVHVQKDAQRECTQKRLAIDELTQQQLIISARKQHRIEELTEEVERLKKLCSNAPMKRQASEVEASPSCRSDEMLSVRDGESGREDACDAEQRKALRLMELQIYSNNMDIDALKNHVIRLTLEKEQQDAEIEKHLRVIKGLKSQLTDVHDLRAKLQKAERDLDKSRQDVQKLTTQCVQAMAKSRTRDLSEVDAACTSSSDVKVTEVDEEPVENRRQDLQALRSLFNKRDRTNGKGDPAVHKPYPPRQRHTFSRGVTIPHLPSLAENDKRLRTTVSMAPDVRSPSGGQRYTMLHKSRTLHALDEGCSSHGD